MALNTEIWKKIEFFGGEKFLRNCLKNGGSSNSGKNEIFIK